MLRRYFSKASDRNGSREENEGESLPADASDAGAGQLSVSVGEESESEADMMGRTILAATVAIGMGAHYQKVKRCVHCDEHQTIWQLCAFLLS